MTVRMSLNNTHKFSCLCQSSRCKLQTIFKTPILTSYRHSVTCPVDALRSGSISYNRATTASHSERERLQQAMAALRGCYMRLTFLDELAVPQILQKFTTIVRNPEYHYRCHNSPSLAYIVKQVRLVHTLPSYFS